jgi:hypothetical protein
MFITRSGQQTAEDAAQIFGGRSLTQTGMGRIIENASFKMDFLSSELTWPPSTAELLHLMLSWEELKARSSSYS